MIRRALTLIELLVTMVIIAIISAAILGTASSAMENARRSRTETLITRINGLIMEKFDTYSNRRVDAHPDFATSIEQSFTGSDVGMAKADVRLLALRELMKFEMPDRWSDVLADPKMLAIRPSAVEYDRAIRNDMTADLETINRFQGAECLYLTVMYRTGDGEARTLFSSQDIGDKDGDGAKEFHDGWGNPISWVRWPQAFTKSLLMTGNELTDHDPFDIYNRDVKDSTGPTDYQMPSPGTRNVPQIMNEPTTLAGLRDDYGAFRLVPLIYSVGADGASDINTGGEGDLGLNPYHPEARVGEPMDTNDDGDENWRDNLTNHLQ